MTISACHYFTETTDGLAPCGEPATQIARTRHGARIPLCANHATQWVKRDGDADDLAPIAVVEP